MSEQFQELKDVFVLFACAMTAVVTRIIKSTNKPSKMFIFGEILIGLAFCFFLAPAVQLQWSLSIQATCAITWVGAYFSGLVLKCLEDLIKAYFTSFTPKNDDPT
jgi:FtsH-binding integral membrane protein